MATEDSTIRVRFGKGDTDIMPLPMAEYVMMRLYERNRKVFATFMRDYYLDRDGGPGADRPRAPSVPGRGPGRPPNNPPAVGS